MGGNVKVKRSYNVDAIRKVLLRLFDTIAEDGFSADCIEPDVEGQCWLACIAEETIGYYCILKRNAVTYEIHAQILPEYRKEYSVESGFAVLQWMMDNTDAMKIIAQVPMIYPNVKAFCQRFGFRVEGILTKSYLKGGELVDQWILGVSRDQVEQILRQEKDSVIAC